MIKEKSVQEQIIRSIREKWCYAVNVNSWSLFKKTWKFVYKVELAPTWTPDILACIDWKFYWIEVKKSEKERRAWNKIVENHIAWLKEFKSHAPVIQQRKTGGNIAEAWWTYICTYSVDHFRVSHMLLGEY